MQFTVHGHTSSQNVPFVLKIKPNEWEGIAFEYKYIFFWEEIVGGYPIIYCFVGGNLIGNNNIQKVKNKFVIGCNCLSKPLSNSKHGSIIYKASPNYIINRQSAVPWSIISIWMITELDILPSEVG